MNLEYKKHDDYLEVIATGEYSLPEYSDAWCTS